MGLSDRIIINTNDRELYNFKDELSEEISRGIHRGFADMSQHYKLDVVAINERLKLLEKKAKMQLYFKIASSAVLLGVVVFKSTDPLQATVDIVKMLLGVF